MEKIVNIQVVDPNTLELQNYSSEDTSLISSYTQYDITFDPTEDYLEYFVLDPNRNVLYGNVSGFANYSLLDNDIVIDPQRDLEAQGFEEGQYFTIYNFLKRKLSSTSDDNFYIQEISSDRTELRLNTNQIINIDIVDLTNQFIAEINSSPSGYKDFYLNFGNNQSIIANNIALDNTDPNDPTILIKLYEPLPNEFSINSRCWVVEQIADSIAYQIALTSVFDFEEELNYISGPNFNLDFQDQINNSTPYYNLNSLNQNISLLGSGSLLYQINSILAEKGIEINIDYSDYSQFIHFSSAQTRLENFYYKLSLIEEYNFSASYTSGVTNYYTSASQLVWLNKINDIITNFDGYEYYLYYESSSYSWPKINSTYPYINTPVNSLQGVNWLTGQLDSASYYDSENKDALINTVPTYLREDDNNQKYFLFVHMIGQHFDNVWTYLKDITNKFDADNRLNYGISKDIVAQAIRDLGVKIYQNNFSTNNLYSALLGITPSGSLFNIPNITGSLPISAGSGLEYIDTVITASSTGSIEPIEDINKEIYKRIYHNLPILLKKKGTTEGLKILLDIYGIPDTILRVNEFGGKSYENHSWDNFVEQFNYAFTSTGSANVAVDLDFSENSYTPTTIQFRFKTSLSGSSQVNQTLWQNDFFFIYLKYTGSYNNSGSYLGSIPNPYNHYGNLIYYNDLTQESCSVYLPFYNEDWWSVMLTTDSSTKNTLYAKNKIYTGYDGSAIGFEASASVVTSPFNSNIPNTTYFLGNGTIQLNNGDRVRPFSGSFQEIRIYNFLNSSDSLSEEAFDDYVMNPYSIEGINLTGSKSSLDSLYFRAPLGTMLDNDISLTTRKSIHPSITTNPPTQSFLTAGNSDYTLNNVFTFEPNTEIIYQDQVATGIKNSVSEKIRIVSMSLPPGNTLSQYISIQQNPTSIETFTEDVNYFEAAFSPQDEINDDIIAQLGSFNLGSYIGDPRYLISGSLNYYNDLNKLRDYYFSKYTHNYDLNDYIRLIKFYDNSLFKMIKDFTPARAGLASGIVIKQTLLERNRYPQPKVNTLSTITFVGSPVSRSINIAY
jgi:hypothetical protein